MVSANSLNLHAMFADYALTSVQGHTAEPDKNATG